MEKTPSGTSVGVDDPYAFVDRCDHLTDDGRCRFAVERGDEDPTFADARSAEEFRCPVVGSPETDDADGPWEWADCPHFRCQNRDRDCARCGLTERRMAHSDERPLLEEHHLSYSDDSRAGAGDPSHEITVYLCRWCHAHYTGIVYQVDSIHYSGAHNDDYGEAGASVSPSRRGAKRNVAAAR